MVFVWSAVTVELLEIQIHMSAGMFRVSYLIVLGNTSISQSRHVSMSCVCELCKYAGDQ